MKIKGLIFESGLNSGYCISICFITDNYVVSEGKVMFVNAFKF